MATREALSPSDLSALQAERQPVHMHVGGVLVFDGKVDRDAVVDRIAQRIHLIPRYRMKLTEPMLGLAHPEWIEDEAFDPERHVHRMALPAPGGDAELCELVGRVLSDPLERDRPLWQIEVVEGLAGDRSAIVAKMHHALVDGLAAVDVSTVILDPTPEGLDLPPPPEDAPPEPRRTLMADQLAELGGFMEKSRQRAREGFTRALEFDPRQAAGQAREAAGVLAELARRREPAPDTRLNIEIGRDRRYAIGRGRLDDVKAVRRAAGATVNDVLLGAVALMLEQYLGGDESPDHAIALVPVSIRRPDEEGELGNRISTVFCELPLRGDPLDRVRAIHSAMEEAKDSSAVRAGALIVGATGLAPPIVSSLAVRAMSGPRLFNLVVSNVPGPQSEFFLSGVPMLEAYPAVPLNPRNQALSVGILSYNGRVYFGLQADHDALPDLEDAAAALERGLERLVEAASGAD